MYLVYKHTSPSGKAYIGITSDYDRRCEEHQSSRSGCVAFVNAINKYGWDNFLHEILYDHLTETAANAREEQLINEHGTRAPCGYNLRGGGKAHRMHQSSKDKISAARKGRPMSAEQKQKMSVAQAGRVITPLHRSRISEALKGRKQTAEHKNNASAAKIGRKAPNTKTTIVDGIEYPSVKAAAIALMLDVTTIRKRRS